MYRTLIALLLAGGVQAHEMTPTYPTFKPSYVDKVYTTQMELFNKRRDVEFYEIGVFDENWVAVNFVSSYKIIKLDYLGHVTFDLYVRDIDVPRVEYICTVSKIRDSGQTAYVSSKICSRVK